MGQIRVNIHQPKNIVIVEKRNEKNVFIINNIIAKRKAKRWKSDVYINDYPRIVTFHFWRLREGKPVKSTLSSRIVLTIKLFFWTFCEKIFKSLKIIFYYHSQLNKLTVFIVSNLSVLFCVPFFVEPVFPERTISEVHLVFALAV